jgi:hypothetical protein
VANLIIMCVFTLFSVCSFAFKAKARGYIFLSVAISSASGYLVGRQVYINSLTDLTYLIYLILFLGMFTYFATYWLKGYEKSSLIRDFPGFSFTAWGLVLILLPLLLVNLYIFSNSISLIMVDAVVDLDSFKNENGVDEFLRPRVGSLALLVSRVFSPLGFLCIPLIVLACIRDDRKLAFLLFLSSLNWVLLGLMSFSRSGLIGYIFVCFMLAISFWQYFRPDIRKSILRAISIPLVVMFSLLVYVTVERFSDPEFWVFAQAEGSIITNPVLFSIFDYFGQWIEHSFILFESTDFVLLFQGHHVTTLLHQVGIPFLSDRVSWSEYRLDVFGSWSNYFVGLPYIFYVDFGLFGLLILFCIASIMVILSMQSGTIRALYFILTPYLLLVSCMFFSDSHFAYNYVQQAGYYALALFIFLKFKFKFGAS